MITKKKLYITDRVIMYLAKGGKPKTAFQVIEHLESETISLKCIRVMLSQLKADGLVSIEKDQCQCCGHATGHYRLTEQGYIKANNLGPALISISQFAD